MMAKVNTKYKTVKRKANVGERILITNAIITEGAYENGDIFTVDTLLDAGVFVKENDDTAMYHREYEVIIGESPSDSERITALETQVAELQAELQTLKKRKKPKYLLNDLLAKHPTPNEQRKAVIERAKAFVGEGYDRWFGHSLCSEEFHVNSDKRTVVALVRGKRSKKVIARGITKCAPDDVFNADIGKAIALGRALGLDVSEFENAPKPTEVVVGMRVNRFNKFGNNLGELAVWKVRILSEGESGPNTHNLNNGNCYCENYGDHITDDTDAKY